MAARSRTFLTQPMSEATSQGNGEASIHQAPRRRRDGTHGEYKKFFVFPVRSRQPGTSTCASACSSCVKYPLTHSNKCSAQNVVQARQCVRAFLPELRSSRRFLGMLQLYQLRTVAVLQKALFPVYCEVFLPQNLLRLAAILLISYERTETVTDTSVVVAIFCATMQKPPYSMKAQRTGTQCSPSTSARLQLTLLIQMMLLCLKRMAMFDGSFLSELTELLRRGLWTFSALGSSHLSVSSTHSGTLWQYTPHI